MRYVSTRGRAPTIGFSGVALAGLAPDGGLNVPTQWPLLSEAEIAALPGLGYAETALAICSRFTGDAVDGATLKQPIDEAHAGFCTAIPGDDVAVRDFIAARAVPK